MSQVSRAKTPLPNVFPDLIGDLEGKGRSERKIPGQARAGKMQNEKLLDIKADFPIFANRANGYPLVYLDSAATSQKPKQVIEAVTKFYEYYNANVHRGIYSLSQEATDLYERARANVAQFIGALDSRQVVFTANASEAINLVAFGWARKHLRSGDIIVTTEMEHHSNIVPWLRLKEELGIKLVYLPLTTDYRLDYKSLLSDANIGPIGRIRLISLSHASNVLGTINPIAEIIRFYKEAGITAKFLVDAAQSVPHITVNIRTLDCDFLAFSSHKMLGPSGVGVLWAKKEFLEQMDPLMVGSHMIHTVTKEKATWAQVPDKFEVGTGRLEGVIGLSTAIDYLQQVGMHAISHHELELTKYSLDRLSKFDDLTLYGPDTIQDRLGVFSFTYGKAHAHDAAEILNRKNVCVRSGHHCAQPLMETLGVSATVRASLYLYNTKKDIDALCETLEDVKTILKL